MPFNEATFWIGLTVAGTGLYFLIEGETKRRTLSVALTLVGLLAVIYSVYVHDHPDSSIRPPVWVWLLAVTWLAIGWDIYDRRMRGATPNKSMLGPISPLAPKPNASARSARVDAAMHTDERIIVDVTPEHLGRFVNQHTAIQADKLVEAYLGKWIKVAGPLGNVYSGAVTFAYRTFGDVTIYMYFDMEKWKDRLSVLTRDARINVIGQIKRVSSMEVQLENCELIDS